jgi:hypothetical protein
MILHKVSPEHFQMLAGKVHEVTFHEFRPVEINRYNFVLVVAEKDKMIAYSTIIEMDKETAYMQHGGALPESQGSPKSRRAYKMMIEFLKNNYLRISTRVKNTNVPMIKFALSEELLIDGCVLYGREVYLSLGWGFSVG